MQDMIFNNDITCINIAVHIWIYTNLQHHSLNISIFLSHFRKNVSIISMLLVDLDHCIAFTQRVELPLTNQLVY
ncbi:hypothetical protein BZL41_26680 [Pseudomonas sp. PIC25]|nr:hypothetical protein BZL41_26680 [Pseudomonas sp. PIC25]